MAYDGITFDGQNLTAIADGGFQATLMSDGRIWGCEVSTTSSAISIQKGEIILCGRLVHFKSVTTLDLSPTISSGVGRIVLTAEPNAEPSITLSDEYSPSSFEELTQEDINNNGYTYQVELARFMVASSQVGAIVSTINQATISNKVIDGIKLALYPVGSIYMSANSTNPTSLFGGTWVAWGQGRVPVGVGSNGTSTYANNQEGGAESVALTTNQMPSHTHTQNSHNHTQTAHNHTFTGSSATTSSAGSHSHGGTYHKSSSGSADWRLAEGSYSTFQVNGEIPSGGAHTHTVTAQGTIGNKTATNQATTAVNNSTGGGQAHNNMQPYITCYMWKRTA